jgi:beta-glucanase (GH16 family)
MPTLRTLVLIAIFVACSMSSLAQNWGTPVWQDEFHQPPDSRLDPAKWNFDIGDLRVNREVEIYCPGFPSEHDQSKPRFEAGWQEISVCDQKDGNVSFDGEHLVLRATEHHGVWTSGRIKTEGHQAFQYGRIEARIKMPAGPGLWPAFWALGDGIAKIGWPASGEIDFMENVPVVGGLGPARIRSTLHGPAYSGDYGIRNDFEFPHGGRVDTGFHTYGAIWSPYMIQFYVDDPANIFFTATPHQLPVGKAWVYNQPFFLILNLAVGSAGSWPKATAPNTPNPADMLVDYVRVYKAAAIPGPKIEAATATIASDDSTQVPVTLTAAPGSGKMYLDCSTIASGLTCSLSPYIVDFTAAASATATLNLVTQKGPPETADVKITAYTLSGDESSGIVHIDIQ